MGNLPQDWGLAPSLPPAWAGLSQNLGTDRGARGGIPPDSPLGLSRFPTPVQQAGRRWEIWDAPGLGLFLSKFHFLCYNTIAAPPRSKPGMGCRATVGEGAGQALKLLPDPGMSTGQGEPDQKP